MIFVLFFSYYLLGDFVKKILLFLIFIIILYIPTVNASSYIGVDVNSGRILYEKNSSDKKLIASTTKIMTCIISIENSSLDKEIIVSDEILKMYGTSIYLEVGEVITVKDLLYGLMLRSGNDAAMVLAYNIFDNYDMFIYKMNELADKLGMNNTVFNNPHGLDEDTKNYSTAYDMSLLARYCYKNKIFMDIIGCSKYNTITNKKSYIWYNRVDILDNYKYSLGGKNGYTPLAGKTLVSYAKNGNNTFLIVSLDDSDIYHNQISLFEKMFKEYRTYKIIDKNTFFSKSSKYYLKKSFLYPLKNNELDNLKIYIKYNNNKSCKRCGNIDIYFKDKIVESLIIYSKP